MADVDIRPEVEALAKMAAKLAGHDPDRRVTIEVGGLVAFDDVAWRYPDFLQRAETAFAVLTSDALKHPTHEPRAEMMDMARGLENPEVSLQQQA